MNLFSNRLYGLFSAVAVLALLGSGVGSAQAASVYFLKIGDVKGESTDTRHKDWIDVDTFYWGISSSDSIGTGGGTRGRAIGTPLSWTQGLDSSAPALFVAVGSGRLYPTATLEVQRTGSDPAVYFQMLFEDVSIASLSINGAVGTPGAAGSLVYSKLTMTYRPQNSNGSLGAPIVGGWDFSDATASTFFGSADVLQGLFLAGPSPSAVPAPAALWLLGTGVLGLIGYKRRGRRPGAARQADRRRRA